MALSPCTIDCQYIFFLRLWGFIEQILSTTALAQLGSVGILSRAAYVLRLCSNCGYYFVMVSFSSY